MFRMARLAGFGRKGETPEPPPAAAREGTDLEQEIVAALRGVYDPEIPLNIHDLGLIYRLEVTTSGEVRVQMTLTAPACPVAGAMPGMVESAIRRVPGVTDAAVELVWDPPWTQDRMSDEARLQLGLL